MEDIRSTNIFEGLVRSLEFGLAFGFRLFTEVKLEDIRTGFELIHLHKT